MKNAQEISEMAEREYKASYDHFKNILKQAYIKGYQTAQEEITTEVKRRVALILSEQEGFIREFMIANLINL